MAEEIKKPKILLVDDDSFLLDMYLLKFKVNGLSVDTVSSSQEALTKLRNGDTYDVLVLDIIMPTIDGVELLKIIREEKICPEANIIMLTNQASEIEHAKKLGVDGYIVKATSTPSEVVNKVLAIYNDKHKK